MGSIGQQVSKVFELCRDKIHEIREFYNEYDHGGEFFALSKFFDAALGWLLRSRNLKIRTIWNCYRVAVVMVFFLMSWKNISSFVRSSDLTAAMDYIWVYYEAVVIVVRYSMIRWYYKSCQMAREFISAREFEKTRKDARKKAFFLTRNIAWMMVMTNVAMVVPSFMIEIEALQFPFNFSDYWINLICHQTYTALIFWFPLAVSFNFVHLQTLLWGFVMEMKVLDETVGFTLNDAMVDSIQEGPSSSDSTSEEQQRIFWQSFNNRLKKCIEQHVVILDNLKTVRPLLNISYMIIYYSTAFNIAGAAFLIMSQLDHPNVYTWQMVALTLVHVVECFLLTRLTSHLNDTNLSIADTVYNLDWPEQLQHSKKFDREYRSTRTQVLLIMERCNQELFTVGGQFQFTQDKFTELMHMAYSLIAFLWDVRMKRG